VAPEAASAMIGEQGTAWRCVAVEDFGAGVAIVSGAVLAALVFQRAAERTPIPAPVVFLVVSAVASDAVTPLRTALSPTDVSWIASAALMVILFDGGVSLGWRRVRSVLGPVAVLGAGATLFCGRRAGARDPRGARFRLGRVRGHRRRPCAH
jgi:hypothetical protein